jgi:murein DD-endopeptidase MepM/ murein hydrolase activator NlpD
VNSSSVFFSYLPGLMQKYPRRIYGSVVALLAGTAITAFGIAPLAPDAAALPQHWVTQGVTPEPLAPQLEALADLKMLLKRSDISQTKDSVDTLLKRLGISDPEAAAWLRADRLTDRLLPGRAGRMVEASVTASGRLVSLTARFPSDETPAAFSSFNRLTVERDSTGAWVSHLSQGKLEASQRLASASISSSLFAATDAANIPDGVAIQMAELFSTEIDFHRELRKGDEFSVVYETLTADGEPVVWSQGTGRVLAAEFVNNGKVHQAYWFGAGKGGYFDAQGESKRHAFLASPMAFSRVTSGFSMRMHPILKTWRAHLGVDYGAPTGTAVRCVGDGSIEYAGVQSGYGNVVIVRHAGDRTTLYGHLSRIDVKKGQRVEQGQGLGAVGSTGWATGPHLHFEFRVNGQHKDPLTVAKASESVQLDARLRPQFAASAALAKTSLQLARDLGGSGGRFE